MHVMHVLYIHMIASLCMHSPYKCLPKRYTLSVYYQRLGNRKPFLQMRKITIIYFFSPMCVHYLTVEFYKLILK